MPKSFTDLMAKGAGPDDRDIPYVLNKSSIAKLAISAGTSALVSGTVTVQTGLATVLAFTATVSGTTGCASGATEVAGIFVGSITTGAVTVTGVYNSYTTGAATLSASGTRTFNWVAFGT